MTTPWAAFWDGESADTAHKLTYARYESSILRNNQLAYVLQRTARLGASRIETATVVAHLETEPPVFDIAALKKQGVEKLLTPGTPLQDIVDWLRKRFPEEKR